VSTRTLFIGGLVAAILIAVGASQFASSQPDGLEFVAEQEGFSDTVEDHDLADSALAEYGENLTDSSTLNTAIAGLVGVVVTLGVGYGVFWLVRKRDDDSPNPATGS
jgi:hypothetical protein